LESPNRNVKPQALNPTGASLLGFLMAGPKTGWDLLQAIDASVGNFWNVTRSQVYSELKALTAAGYLKEGKEQARRKQPYAITASGRSAFKQWLKNEPGPELLRLPIALSVFFGQHVSAAELAGFVANAQARHRQQLHVYQALLETGMAANPDCDDTVLQLGIAYETMMLHWLKLVAARTAARG